MKTIIGAIIGIVVIILIVVLVRNGQSSAPAAAAVPDIGTAAPSSDTGTQTTTPSDTTSTTPSTATTTPTTTAPVTSLEVTTTKQGTGVGAVDGDTVSMNYTGMLTNGTVFDSNTDPKFQHVQPFSFVLGAGQVIQGWDQGIVGMKVGETRHLVIPAALAYGAQSPSPLIPANSDLVFDVQLLSITHK